MTPLRFWRSRPEAVARRTRPQVVVPAVLLSFGLSISLAAGVPERTLAVRVWLVLVGAIVARVLVAMVRARPMAARMDGFDAVVTPAPPGAAPVAAGLKEAAWLVKLASGTAADLHFRVRPVVRAIAAQRLASGHSLDLDDPRDAAAAEAACGPAVWDLVRPGRAVPGDRTGPALDPSAVAGIIGTLESL